MTCSCSTYQYVSFVLSQAPCHKRKFELRDRTIIWLCLLWKVVDWFWCLIVARNLIFSLCLWHVINDNVGNLKIENVRAVDHRHQALFHNRFQNGLRYILPVLGDHLVNEVFVYPGVGLVLSNWATSRRIDYGQTAIYLIRFRMGPPLEKPDTVKMELPTLWFRLEDMYGNS